MCTLCGTAGILQGSDIAVCLPCEPRGNMLQVSYLLKRGEGLISTLVCTSVIIALLFIFLLAGERQKENILVGNGQGVHNSREVENFSQNVLNGVRPESKKARLHKNQIDFSANSWFNCFQQPRWISLKKVERHNCLSGYSPIQLICLLL